MAYRFYLKSAERGNVRGAVLLADYWTTGIPGYVNRRPLDAVLLVNCAFIHLTDAQYLFMSRLNCQFNCLQVGKVGLWAQRIPGQCLEESLGFISQGWHVNDIFLPPHSLWSSSRSSQLQQGDVLTSQQVELTFVFPGGCWVGLCSRTVQCGLSLWTKRSEFYECTSGISLSLL